MQGKGITRLSIKGHPQHGLSAWSDMPLVGAVVSDAVPRERYYRVFDALIDSPARLRAGVWEATAYAERVTDYPYNEIVFVVSGSISIIDDEGHEERFGPGDGFFLEKGFNGEWRQHEMLTIFHMTVDPKGSG
jgi:uncharacterized cupin superfamily protein